jgi:hypothetical protein
MTDTERLDLISKTLALKITSPASADPELYKEHYSSEIPYRVWLGGGALGEGRTLREAIDDAIAKMINGPGVPGIGESTRALTLGATL